MSNTPRTDEHLRRKEENGHVVIVSGDFARQLETELADALGEIRGLRQLVNDCHIVAGQLEAELAEAQAEIERLKCVVISQIAPEPFVLSSYSATAEPAKDKRDKLIEQMRDALEWECQNHCEERFSRIDTGCPRKDCGCSCKIKCALLAAERGE